MSAADTQLGEPLNMSTPGEQPQESVWWLIAVVIGWYILANVPAFFFGFVGAFTSRAMGSRLAESPDAKDFVLHLGVLGAGCVFLAASFIRGRIVGQGDVRAGLSDAPISRRPLITTLVVLTAAYSAFINLAVYSVRPELAAQTIGRSAWLQIFAFLIGVFLAPVAEELFFRGWLWNALNRHWNTLLTASVISGLWTAMHLEQGIGVAIGLIPTAVLLAFARHFGRSVRASIAVHLTMNLIAEIMPWIFIAYR